MPVKTEVSLREFADLAGISSRVATDWVRQGMPAAGTESRKVVHVPTAIKWMCDRAADKARPRVDGETIDEAELRKAVADADLARSKADQAAGDLMPVVDCEVFIVSLCAMVAAQLKGMGGRVAMQLAAESDPAVCRELINDETRRILGALAAESNQRAVVLQSSANADAAAETDAEPMGGSETDIATG